MCNRRIRYAENLIPFPPPILSYNTNLQSRKPNYAFVSPLKNLPHACTLNALFSNYAAREVVTVVNINRSMQEKETQFVKSYNQPSTLLSLPLSSSPLLLFSFNTPPCSIMPITSRKLKVDIRASGRWGLKALTLPTVPLIPLPLHPLIMFIIIPIAKCFCARQRISFDSNSSTSAEPARHLLILSNSAIIVDGFLPLESSPLSIPIG